MFKKFGDGRRTLAEIILRFLLCQRKVVNLFILFTDALKEIQIGANELMLLFFWSMIIFFFTEKFFYAILETIID